MNENSMESIQLKNGADSIRWLPTSIESIDAFLIKKIHTGLGYRYPYALRKNIAYNLQYIEFLDKTLDDLKLTSVQVTQTRKTIIIVGCGIIESVLHYFLIINNKYATKNLKLLYIAPGNFKSVDGKKIKIDSHVYEELQHCVIDEMDFDAMLKKAEKHNILGVNHKVYAILNKLRPLRNKVHLQIIEHVKDTDWNAFTEKNHRLMMKAIFLIFTGKNFSPTRKERDYFHYLKKYL